MNLLGDLAESAERIKFLIRERDILDPPAFEHVLSETGITGVRSAVRAARENAGSEGLTCTDGTIGERGRRSPYEPEH